MKLQSLKPLLDGRVNAPLRGVVEIGEARGPRGGRIMLYLLSCGHWFWNRGSAARPMTETRCTECGLEALLG